MHLTYFSNVKNIIFHTLELIQQVGGFTVSKGGDGIRGLVLGLVDDWVGMWMGHVFQWVQLQDLKVLRGRGQRSGYW